MAVAVGAFLPLDCIAIESLGLRQVAHILRDDRQILQIERYARMIVAEHTAIDLQCTFVSLFCKRPLLFARVHFC